MRICIYSYFDKGCPSKSETVNYKHAKDDGLLLIFASNRNYFFETAWRALKLTMANLLATTVTPRV